MMTGWLDAKIQELLGHRDWDGLHRFLDEAQPETGNDRFSVIHWRVFTFERQKRYDDALEFLDAHLAAFPCQCAALQSKAHLLQMLGREHEALRALEDAPVEAEIASYYALVTDMLFFRVWLGVRTSASFFAWDIARIPNDYVSLFPDGSHLSKHELEQQIADTGAVSQDYTPNRLPTQVSMGFQLVSDGISLETFTQYFPGQVEKVYNSEELAQFGIVDASGRGRRTQFVFKKTTTQNLSEINAVARKCMHNLHRDSYVAAHLRSRLVEAVLWVAVSGSDEIAIADLNIEPELFGKPYGLVVENYTAFDENGLPEKLMIEPGRRDVSTE